jgi:hypothetical protein
MERGREDWDRRPGNLDGCSILPTGCAVTIVLSILMALGSSACVVGCTERLQNTNVSFTAYGSIGHEDLAKSSLPGFAQERVGNGEGLLEISGVIFKIGSAETIGHLEIGNQPDAPNSQGDLFIKSK